MGQQTGALHDVYMSDMKYFVKYKESEINIWSVADKI